MALALALAGCRAPPPAAPPNLILISIDTLRADHLGCYGYPRPTSPAIDGLARQGVVFTTAVANAPWTLASHASLLTGLYPKSHGATDFESGLSDDLPLLSSELGQASYATAALVTGFYFSDRFGFHRGFDKYVKYEPRVDGRKIRRAEEQVDAAIAWLEAGAGRPFFLFLHNFDVHSDYNPSPPFAELFLRPYGGPVTGTTEDLKRIYAGELVLGEADLAHLIDLYDGGIRQVDSELARLLGYLETSGLAAKTIVVVVSDHGEELLDHGLVSHGHTLYEELLRVPLILRGPGIPAGLRVAEPVQLTDVLPSVLELTGVAPAAAIDGRSLVPFWSPGSRPLRQRPVFAEAAHRGTEFNLKQMVRQGRFKLIYDRLAGNYELYDLELDPHERVELSDRRPEVSRVLGKALRSYLASERKAGELTPLSEDDESILRSLGYL